MGRAVHGLTGVSSVSMRAVTAVVDLQGGGWRRKTHVLSKRYVLHSGSGLFIFIGSPTHPRVRALCPPTHPRDPVFTLSRRRCGISARCGYYPRMGRGVHGLTGDSSVSVRAVTAALDLRGGGWRRKTLVFMRSFNLPVLLRKPGQSSFRFCFALLCVVLCFIV